ncbi:uncharacterized protein LOC132933716 [Metopolophium dirhodum]|uniref:uncharacterized protein LOC132933697 n=1 Tax=Metopolophium dirhodum TaxID=44670 RepID=UPI00298FDB05|nr:uncharacterized protein LOC132933697 [Metopolophium dirhodum]XP_060855964.1 uncharacterized protein LOC132933698 [Metopolophium dirhodum]XP_060855965.1 uncharacterized protein LOC132933699 [Metopolophium dirhodum]XP_060855966.1 uncharacterized protein LOC132933700 [Metopolophium dirhodum]XP_060855967.1 uncharacterized protein LOC132933701 [Metopolophium dirhodum]XP_060855968.1 uncharacterized protein LOC132933702 [Metopolophium dirhodum]XP_060855969.1 uncharacterized protein LOC132933703 [
MKSINSAFFYILLAIALCTPNVSSYCGNDRQIEDLRTALITQESISTVLTTLSAIPVTGATLAFAQMMMSGRFGLHLKEVFKEMKTSLDKDHRDYNQCSEILEKTVTASTLIKSTSFGFSLTAMIPGVGLAFLAPRLGTSISAMLLIRERLEFWQNLGCQYATTRDCNL